MDFYDKIKVIVDSEIKTRGLSDIDELIAELENERPKNYGSYKETSQRHDEQD